MKSAVGCSVVGRVAVRRVAVCCSAPISGRQGKPQCVAVWWAVLQCVALQCVAVCCSVLQCVQCVAV